MAQYFAPSLPAGSNKQIQFNSNGVFAADVNLTWDGTTGLTVNKPFTNSTPAAASTPPETITGTWFTGGTSTTTKPQFLVEPTGATSNNWSTSGTGIGVNASSGFAGNLLDLQVNGTRIVSASSSGTVTATAFVGSGAQLTGTTNYGVIVASAYNMLTP